MHINFIFKDNVRIILIRVIPAKVRTCYHVIPETVRLIGETFSMSYVIPETVRLIGKMFSMSIPPASHFPPGLLYKYYRQEYHLTLTAVLPVNGKKN